MGSNLSLGLKVQNQTLMMHTFAGTAKGNAAAAPSGQTSQAGRQTRSMTAASNAQCSAQKQRCKPDLDEVQSKRQRVCSSRQQQIGDAQQPLSTSAQHAQHTGAVPGTSSQQRQNAEHQPVQTVSRRGKHAAGVGLSAKRTARHKGAQHSRAKAASACPADSQHCGVGVATGLTGASDAQHVQPKAVQVQPKLSSAEEAQPQKGPEPVYVDGKPQWEVEALVSHKSQGSKSGLASQQLYMVKWVGDPTPTEEPYRFVKDAPKVLQAYCEKAGLQLPKSWRQAQGGSKRQMSDSTGHEAAPKRRKA